MERTPAAAAPRTVARSSAAAVEAADGGPPTHQRLPGPHSPRARWPPGSAFLARARPERAGGLRRFQRRAMARGAAAAETGEAPIGRRAAARAVVRVQAVRSRRRLLAVPAGAQRLLGESAEGAANCRGEQGGGVSRKFLPMQPPQHARRTATRSQPRSSQSLSTRTCSPSPQQGNRMCYKCGAED